MHLIRGMVQIWLMMNHILDLFFHFVLERHMIKLAKNSKKTTLIFYTDSVSSEGDCSRIFIQNYFFLTVDKM